MGCKAITPHLVSLARKLEGKPFHLLAAHCQNNPKEAVLAYLKSQKLSPHAPNFTVTSFGGHPKVKGNGHVPYYMVFDHHGRLVRHHMCGAYHGGDGLKMIDWVEKLLADAPAIYLGPEPFTTHGKLAAAVAAGKGLPKHLAKVIALQQEDTSDTGKAELARILAGVERYRDDAIARARGLLGTRPGRSLPLLESMLKHLGDTPLAAPVRNARDALKGSAELKNAIALAKVLDKAERTLEKLKPCKACKRMRLRTHQGSCGGCRGQNKGALKKVASRVRKALSGKESLPVAERARAILAQIEGA